MDEKRRGQHFSSSLNLIGKFKALKLLVAFKCFQNSH